MKSENIMTKINQNIKKSINIENAIENTICNSFSKLSGISLIVSQLY